VSGSILKAFGYLADDLTVEEPLDTVVLNFFPATELNTVDAEKTIFFAMETLLLDEFKAF
jgi:hypothetical protein